ncbi:MAG: hypothetical protein H6993_04230 [Pseudomonadales bacterium]|nr:hypothetical protein [Pseudomonadales bacterium]
MTKGIRTALLFLLALAWTTRALAIAPGSSIVNTATVSFEIQGATFTVADDDTLTVDAGAGNSAPHALVLTGDPVPENTTAWVAGTLAAEDLDAGATFSYQVDDPRFVVDGDQLRLAGGTVFDFEATPRVVVDVLVRDGQGGEAVLRVTVHILDVNESPSVPPIEPVTVAGGVDGVSIAVLQPSDPDANDSVTYRLSDPRFTVEDHVLRLLPDAHLLGGEELDLEITVIDSGGLEAKTTVRISAGGLTGPPPELRLLLPHGTDNGDVTGTYCLDPGNDALLSTMTDWRGTGYIFPGRYDFGTATAMERDSPLFVEVTHAAANLDRQVADRVSVTVMTLSGDRLTVALTETGVDSGVFRGAIMVTSTPALGSDCLLSATLDDVLTATYEPADGGPPRSVALDVASSARVFAATTGALLDGVAVTLVDAATGMPATVFGDDGRASFPATIVSGGAVTDSAGTVYQFVTGAYRFPHVPPGNYRLDVAPPVRWRFPSDASAAVLAGLPGAPWRLTPASRGEAVSGDLGSFVADVPLDLLPPAATRADLEVFAAGDASVAMRTASISASSCSGGAPPRTVAAGAFSLPASIPLVASGGALPGDSVFVVLTDADEDRDPTVVDTVTVTVHTGSDEESLQLVETGPSGGVFVGYINTANGSADAAACELVADDDGFSFHYVDRDDSSDSIVSTGHFVPRIRVFSSITGEPLDGVIVTLIDTDTGQAATVTSPDGVAAFPSAVTSGAAAVDANGNQYPFSAGSVFWPGVRPGTYRVEVQAPAAWRFPSARTDAEISSLAGAFRVRGESRGLAFTITAGEDYAFDIPLDPVVTGLFLSKEASAQSADIGDFLQYRVHLQSPRPVAGLGAALVDVLPAGFRYRAGTARLNGVAVEPVIGELGRTLRFPLTNTGAASDVELSYVTEVTVAAVEGSARNAVSLTGPGIDGVVSAQADVVVRNSLLGDRAFLVGQVTQGCDADADGVAGVRVLLETGAYVLTDRQGRYHLEGLNAGTHVVQLDPASIPAGWQPVVCDANNRVARSGDARFVDLARGALGRADFALGKAPPPVTEWSVRLDSRGLSRGIEYSLSLHVGALVVDKGSVGIVLPDGLRFEPASARLDGEAMADPPDHGAGALAFVLPRLAANSRHELRFRVRYEGVADAPEARAMVTLYTATGRHRSTMVSNLASLPPREPPVLVQTAATSPPDPVVVRTQGVPAIMTMPLPVADAKPPPYTLPPVDNGEPPEFTTAWLATQSAETALLWPLADHNPRIPAVSVVIKHAKSLRAELSVDGGLVNPVAFLGTVTDHARGVTLSRWKDVPVSEGDSELRVLLRDGSGRVVETVQREVHFGQAPARAELVAAKSFLVADGVNAPMIAVRFFDRSGKPARPGLTGEFSVNAPFRPLDLTKEREVPVATQKTYQVRREGIAFIQLEPTLRTGDVVLTFAFGEHRQERVHARLKSGATDLVVVGLAESTLRSVDDDMPGNATVKRNGRVAFLAKGKVGHDWQVTAGYDSDKPTNEPERFLTDPGRFYPLYGDGTEQQFDAVSRRRAYLRAENDRMELEAGDFDTGLERSELARYTRTLNGVRGAWTGARMTVQAFVSDTGDAHVQDQLRGDGTSGVYRLERSRLRPGSERVSLVTRDRLHTERELKRQTLLRFLDYSIDYAQGTLLFKQPVQSQDGNFDPVFIEVSYDVDNASGGGDLMGGGRVAWSLGDGGSEAGLTVLRDTAAGADLSLDAVDLDWRVRDDTRVHLEAARSDGAREAASWAMIAAVEHRRERFSGQAYFRQQDADFGVGLSPATEADTRKFGLEGEYRAGDNASVRAELFRQETMRQGGRRDVAGIESRHRLGETLLHGHVQTIRENPPGGAATGGTLVGLGAARNVFDGRLALRADSEFNVGGGQGSADYPDRVTAGAELAVTPEVSLLVAQELSLGKTSDLRHSRLGVRSRPWQGGSIESWVGREMNEQGERLFANTGLVQQWQVSPNWLLDAGLDQVKTLSSMTDDAASGARRGGFNPAAPPAAGGESGDFTAWFLGATLRRDAWHVSNRVERHEGEQADKWNYLLGVARQLEDGKAVSLSGSLLDEQLATGVAHRQVLLRGGFAWRPPGSAWTLFNRVDLDVDELTGDGPPVRTRRLVENVHVNRRAGRHEFGAHAGVRVATGRFDDFSVTGLTVLTGVEYRFDLSSRWDVGVHSRWYRSVDAGVGHTSHGLELGRSFGGQAWVSVGYNMTGFTDDDFADADYSARGPYLKFRLRLDQRNVERFLGFVKGRSRADGTTAR